LILTVNGEVDESFTHEVEYQGELTPLLSSISPRYGSVLGGDEITLTGTGF